MMKYIYLLYIEMSQWIVNWLFYLLAENENKGDTSFECDGGWIRNDDFGACYCFIPTKRTWLMAQVNKKFEALYHR